jgi:hypothetical protein
MQTPPQAPSGRPGAPSGTPPDPGTVRRPGVARPLPDPVAGSLPDPVARSPLDPVAGSLPDPAARSPLDPVAGSLRDPAAGSRQEPAAVRRCAVPDAAPPYDDEVTTDQPLISAGELAAGIMARLDHAASPRATAIPQAAATAGAAARGEQAEGGRESLGREAARAPGLPGGPPTRGQPDAWPSRFAQVLAETLAGSRPPAQLTPWTTERARTHIRRLGPLLAAGQRPFVHRVVTSLPASGVIEMSVVVGFGPRVRALAVRLERADSRPASPGVPGRPARWLCTAVEAA